MAELHELTDHGNVSKGNMIDQQRPGKEFFV
jgi:hypothetical protein